MHDVKPIDILIVDDSDDDVLIIQRAIKKARLIKVVHVVNDGQAAMAYLRKQDPFQTAHTPGLVLLDINMPIKNGFEVLREIKADDQLRSIPVVMLTTSSRDEDVIKSYKDGACSYISKPVSINDLDRVIEQFSLYWTLISKIPPVDR